MTLLDVEELTGYWIEHPPLHLVIAAYLQGGEQRKRPAAFQRQQAAAGFGSSDSVEQLLAELGPAFAGGSVHAGFGPVVLDFTELRRKSQSGVLS